MTKATAAVVVGPRQEVELQSIEIPPLELGAMVVEVEAATLCGTDVELWRTPGRAPYIPGHESCGRVIAIEGTRHDTTGRPIEIGDRIIWTYPFCGECFYCAIAQQPSYCPTTVRFGHEAVEKFPYLLGGCSTHHYVPPKSGIVTVPEGVSSALAASTSCALRTALRGFDLLGNIASHEIAVVQGSGPIGLYATAIAATHGFNKVLVIGAPAPRLEVAKAFGASETLDLDEVTNVADRRQWVLDRTGGRGADVVFQCAASGAIPEGLGLARQGGRFVSIGTGNAVDLQISSATMSKTIIMVRGGVGRYFYEGLQFIESGVVPFERLISNSYQLAQTTDAIKAMEALTEVKPVITPMFAGGK